MENKWMSFLLGLSLLAVTTFQHASGTAIGFSGTAGCYGLFYVCDNLQPDECCNKVPRMIALAVSFQNLPGDTGSVYGLEGCTSNKLTSGHGNGCFECPENGCGSAIYSSCPTLQLVGDTDVPEVEAQSKHCTKTVSPNVVMYKDETTKVTLVLQHENPLMVYEEVKNMSDAEKLDWFRARGATLSEDALNWSVGSRTEADLYTLRSIPA